VSSRQLLNLIPRLKIKPVINMFNLWLVVSEGSSGACFLGSEGAAIRGRLGYRDTERRH
jgi:hypothetical protein